MELSREQLLQAVGELYLNKASVEQQLVRLFQENNELKRTLGIKSGEQTQERTG